MADRAAGLPIAREGLPFVLVVAVPTVVAGFVGLTGLSFLLGALTCYVAWFFRNPSRVIPPGDHLIVSPGDGQVLAIQEEFEPRFLKVQSIRISIFLNIFDVHINRMPCSGVVHDVVYQPGQFLAANRPEASVRNEQNALMIQRQDGKKVLCSQVAGLIARRIVCWVSPREGVTKGERFGLIRFGSRMDLFLPAESTIKIVVGERVKGGTSILGELPCADPS